MQTINHFLSLLLDIYRGLVMNMSFGKNMQILNKTPVSGGLNSSAFDVAASLQRMILRYSSLFIYWFEIIIIDWIVVLNDLNRLKGKYLADDGKSVDYRGLRNDELFLEFENLVDQLYHVELDQLNLNQLKAFFISITALKSRWTTCRFIPDTRISRSGRVYRPREIQRFDKCFSKLCSCKLPSTISF